MLVVWLVAPEVPVIRTLNLPFGVLLPVKSVSTEFAPWLPGITLDGEKLQLAPVGSPEQDSATVELTAALIGVMVTINWTEFPGFTLAALGFSEMEKSTPVPLRLTAIVRRGPHSAGRSGMPIRRGGRYIYALPDELNR